MGCDEIDVDHRHDCLNSLLRPIEKKAELVTMGAKVGTTRVNTVRRPTGPPGGITPQPSLVSSQQDGFHDLPAMLICDRPIDVVERVRRD
jgi:hypothetical protein